MREELESADVGDLRRTRRLIAIGEDLAASPNASVPQASRDRAAMQGMYDFWANRRIDADAIIRANAIGLMMPQSALNSGVSWGNRRPNRG